MRWATAFPVAGSSSASLAILEHTLTTCFLCELPSFCNTIYSDVLLVLGVMLSL